MLRAIAIDAFARLRDASIAITQCVDRDRDRAMPVKVVIADVDGRRDAGESRDLFFLSLSLSLSLFSIFQGRKSFEVKMETEMIFRYFGSQIRSTGNTFQFDRI